MFLGNLDARRDWGHARDYVEAAWLMLQQDKPDDYVIASGEQYSVRDFVSAAAGELKMPLRWEGEGVDERGFDAEGNCVVAVDPKYFRPTEVDLLIGDATKARTKLGWAPKYQLQDLVTDMMQSDIKVMQKESYLKEGGFQSKNYFE